MKSLAEAQKVTTRVEIDPGAGFCPGVRRAIRQAEEEIRKGGDLAVIGELIHNRREIRRLEGLGIELVDQEALAEAQSLKAIAPYRRLMIRAHGLPKKLYQRLQAEGYEVIDGTCPVVERSQRLVRRYFERGYQVVIVGKPHHPEVVALVGQVEGPVWVAMEPEDVQDLDPGRPVLLMAQTTIEPERFERIRQELENRVETLEVRNTICKAISGRHAQVRDFAARHDVVIFVGGRNSSNTKVLFGVCKSVNPRSHWIESEDEIERDWFVGAATVGVSGSASTPPWQLEQVARYVEHLVGSRR